MQTQLDLNISGKVHDKNYFHYFDSNTVQFSEILAVLQGKKLGCIFRDVVPNSFSDTVYSNAFNGRNLKTENQSAKRSDEAPPVFVGTQHYKKKLNHYLDEAERVSPQLERLFHNIKTEDDFFRNFITGFSQFLKMQNITIRLANHEGRNAAPFWIRSFDASQEYMISPHDDLPQLRSPEQAGFEIQTVSNIIAVNICLENENDGILYHYNLQPDDTMRKIYGVEDTGYPYPDDVLENIEAISLKTKKGDFYFLNAHNIHSVKALEKSQNLRTTFSWFMGFKDPSTLLYWI